jgi:hypothetical protein
MKPAYLKTDSTPTHKTKPAEVENLGASINITNVAKFGAHPSSTKKKDATLNNASFSDLKPGKLSSLQQSLTATDRENLMAQVQETPKHDQKMEHSDSKMNNINILNLTSKEPLTPLIDNDNSFMKPKLNLDPSFRLDDALGVKNPKKDKAVDEMNFLFDGKVNDTTSEKPYHKDGDMEFYTPENVKKRDTLKTNKMVMESINRFMTIYNFDRDYRIDRDEYFKVHTRIAKLFRKDIKEKTLKKILEEDWKHDSKGKPSMSKQDVFDSLFELADIWTPKIDPFMYSGFFDKLFSILHDEDLKHGNKNPYDIM